jgi:hypothetical protein
VQSFNEYAAAGTTYLAAALALLVDHSNTIMQVLGFVLLVARLIKEVPSAYRIVKGWCHRG